MNKVTIQTDKQGELKYENNFTAMIGITEEENGNRADCIVVGEGKGIMNSLGAGVGQIFMSMLEMTPDEYKDHVAKRFFEGFGRSVSEYRKKKEEKDKEMKEVLNEILRKAEEKVHG